MGEPLPEPQFKVADVPDKKIPWLKIFNLKSIVGMLFFNSLAITFFFYSKNEVSDYFCGLLFLFIGFASIFEYLERFDWFQSSTIKTKITNIISGIGALVGAVASLAMVVAGIALAIAVIYLIFAGLTSMSVTTLLIIIILILLFK